MPMQKNNFIESILTKLSKMFSVYALIIFVCFVVWSSMSMCMCVAPTPHCSVLTLLPFSPTHQDCATHIDF